MFRIRFQGLLTHADLNGQVVVVYNEPRHRAILTVNDIDWIKNPNTDPPVIGTDTGVSCFRLYGAMQLRDVEKGPVQNNLNGLPKLIDICNGNAPRTEIIYRRTHPDFHGYLELEGGTLSIEDWFEENVTFDNFTLRCLPRTIMFGTTATAATVRFEIDSRYLTLKPDAEVTVSNLDFSGVPTPNEYQTYKNFFTDATMIQPPVESTTKCPYGSAEVTRPKCKFSGACTLGVQCSNNGFP